MELVAMRYQAAKFFDDYPCAHRCWNHDGKCRLVHGYERSFIVTFEASMLDPKTGFVIDLSDLKDVRELLAHQFDHTTVISHDDPALMEFRRLAKLGVLDLRVMDHAGIEGAGTWVLKHADELVSLKTAGRVRVAKVEARENRKNSVIVMRDEMD
jgi:6-pyruvoyltetrahydropterin/6-carboxytetrahydropterin synthase